MNTPHRSTMKLCAAVGAFLFAACSSSPDGGPPAGTGGAPSATGGSHASTGGTGTGGSTPSTGGSAGTPASSEGGRSGGSRGDGGSPSTGGRSGTGGDRPATGGSTATGGSNGGSAGGRSGAAGSPATGGTTGTGGAGGGTGSGTNHVFLLLGQSNMAGYPKAQASDKEKNAQIQVIGFDNCTATGRKQDQWDVAVPPLHECSVGALGPGDWFSKTIISKFPAGSTVWLVPNAFSGEKIATMRKGGTHWSTIIARAKKAQEKGPIEGMLFHQGESDCGNADWPSWVKGFYTELKTELGLTKDVPFLVGELPPTSACSNHNPLVAKVPGLIGSNAYVISSQGLKIDPADTQWNMHFDHDSQVTFGKRYADTMIKALGL